MRRKRRRRITKFRITFYTRKPLPDEMREHLHIPGNPYANLPADHECTKYLNNLGAVYYRDSFHGNGKILDPAVSGTDGKGTYYWHSVTLETDNSTFCRVAKRPNDTIDPKYGDCFEWILYNVESKIEGFSEKGVVHERTETNHIPANRRFAGRSR